MPIADQEWSRAVDVLSAAPHVALACHVEPDGDALGSMLALQQFLQQRGVRTVASYGSSGPAHETLSVPPQYTFLPGLDGLVTAEQFPSRPPVLVAFDTASPDRLGTLRHAVDGAGCVIVIDHHASGEAFGDIRLCEGSAAATAVLVEALIRHMGGDIDRDIATCLYVGLVTDTGRFQYASTTPEVMELGARLIAHDIDHAAINRQVWSAHSFGYLKVLGRAMDRATLVPEVGLAWTAVQQDDLADLGIALQETEGLIDVLHGLEAAECALVVKQQPGPPGAPEQWKASLRSKGAVDVGVLARALGGGGHRFSAGFNAEGPLERVVGSVVDELSADALQWAG
jgi:bifunctional oligoribonuclease and PAP phosphatase NrnA